MVAAAMPVAAAAATPELVVALPLLRRALKILSADLASRDCNQERICRSYASTWRSTIAPLSEHQPAASQSESLLRSGHQSARRFSSSDSHRSFASSAALVFAYAGARLKASEARTAQIQIWRAMRKRRRGRCAARRYILLRHCLPERSVAIRPYFEAG
eukprot:6212313-Pleurochrysis_carterae.AAC.3